MIRQKGARLWVPAVVAHLRIQDKPIDGKALLCETRMLWPEGTEKTLNHSRSCPTIQQIARWAKEIPEIEVTILRRKGLTGTSRVNHYEWVGA